jgi:SMI1-KNR4 cell-wall
VSGLICWSGKWVEDYLPPTAIFCFNTTAANLLDADSGSWNGGRSRSIDCAISLPDCDDVNYSIHRKIEVFFGRFPSGCFPISGDAFGNLILLSVRDADYGSIYFWDHERDSATTELSRLAPSFEEFVVNLSE